MQPHCSTSERKKERKLKPVHIPNFVITDGTLSAPQRVLLMLLISHDNDQGQCYPKEETLARERGDKDKRHERGDKGPRQVQRDLQVLIDNRYIPVPERQPFAKNQVNHYNLDSYRYVEKYTVLERKILWDGTIPAEAKLAYATVRMHEWKRGHGNEKLSDCKLSLDALAKEVGVSLRTFKRWDKLARDHGLYGMQKRARQTALRADFRRPNTSQRDAHEVSIMTGPEVSIMTGHGVNYDGSRSVNYDGSRSVNYDGSRPRSGHAQNGGPNVTQGNVTQKNVTQISFGERSPECADAHLAPGASAPCATSWASSSSSKNGASAKETNDLEGMVRLQVEASANGNGHGSNGHAPTPASGSVKAAEPELVCAYCHGRGVHGIIKNKPCVWGEGTLVRQRDTGQGGWRLAKFEYDAQHPEEAEEARRRSRAQAAGAGVGR